MGIRTQESLTRYRSIVSKSGPDAFLRPSDHGRHIVKAYPIYDWTTEDVWLAPDLFGWDYNRAYDVMARAGLSLAAQRCAPPFGEQPIRRLWTYAVCWPALWARMVDRVPGAATAARYANTDLYGLRLKDEDLPTGTTWRDKTFATLNTLDAVQRAEVARALRAVLSEHQRQSKNPMPDSVPDPQSGFCWREASVIASAGGNKLDRQRQRVSGSAREIRRRKLLSDNK
jgi:predicted phosphoadenosine phosphosulfate sulfurtransferase